MTLACSQSVHSGLSKPDNIDQFKGIVENDLERSLDTFTRDKFLQRIGRKLHS